MKAILEFNLNDLNEEEQFKHALKAAKHGDTHEIIFNNIFRNYLKYDHINHERCQLALQAIDKHLVDELIISLKEYYLQLLHEYTDE